MKEITETVLVTGASSGIGLELAKCFAAEKSNLILTARNRDALEKLATQLRAEQGISVEIVIADLAQPESPQNIFRELQGRGTVVDVLVNNAGFGLHGEFAELPLRRQMEIVQVNVAVSQMSAGTQSAAANAEESASAAEELSGQAQTMQTVVRAFVVGNAQRQSTPSYASDAGRTLKTPPSAKRGAKRSIPFAEF